MKRLLSVVLIAVMLLQTAAMALPMGVDVFESADTFVEAETINGERAEPDEYWYELMAMGDYDGNVTGATWYWPIHGYSSASIAYSKITSSYGFRGGDYQRYHKGVDIGEIKGTSVYAVRSGTVFEVNNSTTGSAGRYIIINHNDGYYSIYMHLSQIDVSIGQNVSSNTRIGAVGGSGYGSESYYGYHLHLGIHYGSSFDWECNVNPCPSGYTRVGSSLQSSNGGYPVGSASISYIVDADNSTNIVPSAPKISITNCTDTKNVNFANANFTWTAVEGGYGYVISLKNLDTDEHFVSGGKKYNNLNVGYNGSQYFDTLEEDTNYRFAVGVLKADGITAYDESWSELNFKTAKRPTFTSPSANSTVSPENLKISWTNDDDAEYYGILIKDSNGIPLPGYDSKKGKIVYTNSHTVSLDYGETYTIGVYALLGGQTIWGSSSLVLFTEDAIVDEKPEDVSLSWKAYENGEEISFQQNEITLFLLRYNMYPEDVDYNEINVELSNPDVASFGMGDGYLRLDDFKVGSTKITLSLENSEIYLYLTVNPGEDVSEEPEEEISLSWREYENGGTAEVTLNSSGKPIRPYFLFYEILPEDYDVSKVSVELSDPNVVSVNIREGDIELNNYAVGKTKITLTYEGKEIYLYFVVNPAQDTPDEPDEPDEPVIPDEPDEPVEYKATMTLSDVSGRQGETVKVIVSLKTDEIINTIGIRDITYDTSVLTFAGFSDYEELQSLCQLSQFDESKMAVVAALKEKQIFDGEVCTLNFTINENAGEGDVAVNAVSHIKLDGDVIATEVVPATVSITLQMLGDMNLNDVVDMNDAILLLQYSMFPDLYPIGYKGSVDFTKDGVVDMNDAILLLQYSMFPDLYPIE